MHPKKWRASEKEVITNNADDYLMISGIQHFDFCRRQWALIHIEQQWQENYFTTVGQLEHSVCHDDSRTEKRKDIIIMRGMRVVSHKLKMTGVCDVVEFHTAKNGITLNRYDGTWLPFPIEYKHGLPKTADADRLQLCAQAMALEEMLVCDIKYGCLYYKTPNKREKVEFTQELRERVAALSKEMYQYFDRGWTPKVKTSSRCRACSLNDICLPKLCGRKNVSDYINDFIGER